MANKEKMVKALHEYVDSLDDNGLYEFINNEELSGGNIFDCDKCCEYFGECEENLTTKNQIEACKQNYMKWLKK
jgi:hypothetical protein